MRLKSGMAGHTETLSGTTSRHSRITGETPADVAKERGGSPLWQEEWDLNTAPGFIAEQPLPVVAAP
jgi:hypothetical protein